MLMALLPFTAWAQTGILSKVTVAPFAYGGYSTEEGNAQMTGISVLVYNEDGAVLPTSEYEVGATFEKKVANEWVDETETDFKKLTIGTYRVKITGKNTYVGSELWGEFVVSKAKLYVDYLPKTKSVVYGTTTWPALIPDNITAKTYNNVAVTLTAAQKEALTFDLTDPTNLTVANSYPAGVNSGALLPGKSLYDFTYSGLETTDLNDCYDIDYSTLAFQGKVRQVSIAAPVTSGTGFYATVTPLADNTYSGEDMSPVYKIEYQNSDMFQTTKDKLRAGIDYELIYKWSATEDGDYAQLDGNAHSKAGYYKVFVKGKTTGNYYTDDAGVEYEAFKFQIKKKAVTIQVNPKGKTYDGVAYTTADVEYTIGGLVDADQGHLDLTTLTPKVDNAVWANFKDYKLNGYEVSVDVTGANLVHSTGTTAVATPLATNYTVTPLSSVWNINKAALTITAESQTILFDAAIPVTTITATGSAAALAEADDIVAAYKAPAATTANNHAYGVQENIYTPVRKVADDYTTGGDAAVEAANALLANYNDPTIVAGSLTVNAGAFTIMPIVTSTNYDGLAHAATGYSAVATVGGNAYVLTDDDLNVTDLTYKYKNVETDGEWTATVPIAKGTYRAKVEGVVGVGSFAYATVENPEVQFTINAKPITITITSATLHEGDTEANLKDHTTFTLSTTTVNDEKIAWEPAFVRDGDAINVTGLVVDAETGKISTTDLFTGVGAVTGKLLTTGQYNDNYAVTFVAGNLTIANDSLEIDGSDITLAINEAAAAGNPYNVTIKERKLSKDQWNTLVLPFDVEPLAFCNVVNDYAVFNTLTSAENGNVKFSLTRTTIPAHTPFLVKPTKDILLGTTHTETYGQAHDYVFRGVEIKSFKTTDVDGVPAVTVDDAQYIGTYTGVSLSEGDGIYVPVSGKFYPLADVLSQYHIASVPLPYTAAYLNVTSGTDARIFVEEADGTITAISNITADGVAMKAEGWYTVNGIRLQGAPTEKGVYINNGKKVVIK